MDTVQFKNSFGQVTKLTNNRAVCTFAGLGFWADNAVRNLTFIVHWGAVSVYCETLDANQLFELQATKLEASI